MTVAKLGYKPWPPFSYTGAMALSFLQAKVCCCCFLRMWTSIACKYFYLLPLKLENMFCICHPCFRPAQIAAEIGSRAVTALAKFTIYTSIDVQCPAFSLFLRENGLSFIHPDQEEISAAQGEGFLLCGPWKSS